MEIAYLPGKWEWSKLLFGGCLTLVSWGKSKLGIKVQNIKVGWKGIEIVLVAQLSGSPNTFFLYSDVLREALSTKY